MVDGVAHVLVDEVGVEGDGRSGPGAGGGDQLGAGVDDVAGGPHAGHGGVPGAVDGHPALRIGGAAQIDEQGVVRDEAWRYEQRIHRDDAAVGQVHPTQMVGVVDDQTLDAAFHDVDAAGEELGPLGDRQPVRWGEVHDVVAPLPNDLCVADRAWGAADHSEASVTDFVAVTVGAVQHISSPPLGEPWYGRQFVDQAGRDEDAPGPDSSAVRQQRPERVTAVRHQRGDSAVDDVAAVTRDLPPSSCEQVPGGHAVAGQVAVQMACRRVARRPGVDHENASAGSGQHQGGRQAGCATADDDHVVLVHGTRLGASSPRSQERCHYRETGVR